MNKKEVQQRVLKNGKPLALSKFSWDEKTNTFRSKEFGLVLDFRRISYCTFDTGSDCTFKTGSYCTFKTGFYCTFKTGSDCTFDTGSDCTFKTGSDCTFKTGSDCTFKTGYDCTFKTGSYCTFDVFISCFILNKEKRANILIIRKDFSPCNVYELDKLNENIMIYFKKNEEPIYKEIKDFKIIDNQTVIINSTKQFNEYTIYSVKNIKDYFNDVDKPFKIVSKEFNNKTYYVHCEEIKKGIEDINFKIARQNSSLSDIAKNIKEKNDVINWYDYRLITGACEFGTKDWLSRNNYTTDDTMNISEFYERYKEEQPYGFNKFEEFYKEIFN